MSCASINSRKPTPTFDRGEWASERPSARNGLMRTRERVYVQAQYRALGAIKFMSIYKDTALLNQFAKRLLESVEVVRHFAKPPQNGGVRKTSQARIT